MVLDLEVVRDNYHAFARSLPDTRVFYAVKANPAPEVLRLLASLGSCFDTASVQEIEMVLAAGATADRISFGNTIKKERDIARAFQLGVRLFAVDCEAEVEKIARVAQGAQVFCRILCDGAGAEWPLSKKFGCAPSMAPEVLERAQSLGLIESEVVLISKKSDNEDEVRWVYLDIGKFGGLAETMDESIRYPIRTPRDGDALAPCVLAGPTCDSADVLYEKQPYPLPVSLEIGDRVLIEGTGAYTSTYSAVAFNGFPPLKTYHI
jgi:diaminopimelate decarboxylase